MNGDIIMMLMIIIVMIYNDGFANFSFDFVTLRKRIFQHLTEVTAPTEVFVVIVLTLYRAVYLSAMKN